MLFTETPADELLAPLSRSLCEDREEAVKARKAAGLDEIWARAREQYQGIDEVNRGRHRPVDGKSTTLDGPVHTTMGKVDREERSTVFVNITRPYTNAGTARVADILFPTGKMPWDLRASPVSDLEILVASLSEYPEEMQAVLEQVPELAAKLEAAAAPTSIDAAKETLTDWLKESDWMGESRQQIVEAGKVGTGILKGPFPQKRQVSSLVQQTLDMLPFITVNSNVGAVLQAELQSKLQYSPVSECIKVENCYPAPDCGEDIQNGKFFFERIPQVSRRRLEDLLDDPSYFPEQIRACIKEGPKSIDGQPCGKDRGFDLWVRTGDVDAKQMQQLDSEDESLDRLQFLTIVLCNDRIVKIEEPLLDTKRFPYDVLRWEPRQDSWTGIGVPEQIETPQRGVNASVRALSDNMGYSVGPQVLRIKGLIEPADGKDYSMQPYKFWDVLVDSLTAAAKIDPKEALTFLEFPNYLNEIMPVIQYWLKMAEDTTGLPLLLQGQASTDAVGVSQQLMNNSTTNLRLIIKQWDDDVCKPQITAYYDWCQSYGPEAAKGDAVAVPLGSSSLLIKELQMQALMQIGDRVLQPIYGKSPAKWMDLFLEGFQIDPDMLAPTEEELAKLEEASSQPDPKVQVAQIETQAQMAIAEMRKATDEMRIALDAQQKELSIAQARDAVETQAAANIAQESMKQEGKQAEQVGKAGQASEPPELDVDSALGILGLAP